MRITSTILKMIDCGNVANNGKFSSIGHDSG